jgi:periplasmic protein TonB
MSELQNNSLQNDSLVADDHLDHLLISATDEPWFKSLSRNVKELINPPKLPPLVITSKPVEVKNIWGLTKGNESKAATTSLIIHSSVAAFLLLVGTNQHVQQLAKQSVSLIAPDLAPFKPAPGPQKPAGGGGGGGDRSPLPASKGRLPKASNRQFTPPMAVVNNPNPKLIMEPTIIAPPNAVLPQVNMAQYGDPFGRVGPASNGPGSGGGIGSGSGGGVGSGKGPGVGPGEGGGIGGGAYRIGGGVSAPALLFKVEPEYSEEARKAKFQGTVVLYVVVDDKGMPQQLRVLRPLGLGLDEKAIEAVQKWRFKPGLKDGKPVPVAATIEVNFRLL